MTWKKWTMAGPAASLPSDTAASTATRMATDSTKCSGQTAAEDRRLDDDVSPVLMLRPRPGAHRRASLLLPPFSFPFCLSSAIFLWHFVCCDGVYICI
jgi:hypothetical protein